jgi:sugar phosphate isomerase/epimerase
MKTFRYPVLFAMLSVLSAGVSAGEKYTGLQLWSLRDQVKADVPAALDWVKAQGITAVETAGTGNLSAEEFSRQLRARGITAVSAHIGYEALAKDLPEAIRTAKALGVRYVITAWIPHQGAFTAEQARQAATDFNKWGEAFRAEGIRYGYHPHGYEFVPIAGEGGKTPFDLLLENTKPELVCFEMDVFWVFHAGQDPAALLRKHPDRWLLMHVKDIRKGAVTGLSTGHAAPIDNVAVGTGQIDWTAVFKAADEIGLKEYFIEDETPTPLICIPESLRFLRTFKL